MVTLLDLKVKMIAVTFLLLWSGTESSKRTLQRQLDEDDHLHEDNTHEIAKIL
jgi:hypothetical protein